MRRAISSARGGHQPDRHPLQLRPDDDAVHRGPALAPRRGSRIVRAVFDQIELVVPAKAGIQGQPLYPSLWTPASAGVTGKREMLRSGSNRPRALRLARLEAAGVIGPRASGPHAGETPAVQLPRVTFDRAAPAGRRSG